MVRRDVKKTLMSFLRNEVREKSADWGELRRVKSHIIVKRGLPNIPSLVIQSDEGLSYFIVINWRNELRLYLFNSEGNIFHGQSYYSNLEEVYKDIKKKSKKIARFPPLEKPETQSQREVRIDNQFRGIWIQLAKLYHIPQIYRKNRPLIKEIKNEGNLIFGTEIEEGFICVPNKPTRFSIIFTFYSLLYFLPKNIRLNFGLGQALAFRFLLSIKKFQNELPDPKWEFKHVFDELQNWSIRNPVKTLSALFKISEYYDSTWKTTDFLELINSDLDLVENSTRSKLPIFCCYLFKKTNNLDFLILSNFLGLPFDRYCLIPTHFFSEELISIYRSLQSYNFKELLNYLDRQDSSKSVGMIKAMKEALNFQYGSVLEITVDTSEDISALFRNKADLPIKIISITQVFPDGREINVPFREITIDPSNTFVFDLNMINESRKTPIKFEYQIVKTYISPSRSLFKGTVVI